MSRLAFVVALLALSAAAPARAQGERPVSGPTATRLSGFFVGSFSYNSALQIVPEAFGGAAGLADPGRTSVRFDKFGLAASRMIADWLTASAAVEIESHRDRHGHLITPTTTPNRFGCPAGEFCERFGAEAPAIEVGLDRFHVTAVAPVGNGLALSLGRFDAPFGVERHDDNLNLTATTSEIFRFARPQRFTGFQAAYVFSPRFDVTAWVANRWEAEDTGEGDFNDINGSKSVGARVGISPLPGDQMLNVGLGAWRGRERAEGGQARWLLDADLTWGPNARTVLAAEAVRGAEDGLPPLRQVGLPVAEAPEATKDATWWGFYVVGHYDFVEAFGVTLRYGTLKDADRARTGVSQDLRSFTVAPTLHLSALVRELQPVAAAVPRTRHPYHWVDVKLEYRWNDSDRPVFGEALPNISLHDRRSEQGHQVQLQLAVNF